MGTIFGFVLPPLASQLGELVANFPSGRERVQQRLPPDNAMLGTVVDQVFRLPSIIIATLPAALLAMRQLW